MVLFWKTFSFLMGYQEHVAVFMWIFTPQSPTLMCVNLATLVKSFIVTKYYVVHEMFIISLMEVLKDNIFCPYVLKFKRFFNTRQTVVCETCMQLTRCTLGRLRRAVDTTFVSFAQRLCQMCLDGLRTSYVLLSTLCSQNTYATHKL